MEDEIIVQQMRVEQLENQKRAKTMETVFGNREEVKRQLTD